MTAEDIVVHHLTKAGTSGYVEMSKVGSWISSTRGSRPIRLPAPEPIEKLKQAAHPIDSSQQHQQIRIELAINKNLPKELGLGAAQWVALEVGQPPRRGPATSPLSHLRCSTGPNWRRPYSDRELRRAQRHSRRPGCRGGLAATAEVASSNGAGGLQQPWRRIAEAARSGKAATAAVARRASGKLQSASEKPQRRQAAAASAESSRRCYNLAAFPGGARGPWLVLGARERDEGYWRSGGRSGALSQKPSAWRSGEV
jgi:hypothetical protein